MKRFFPFSLCLVLLLSGCTAPESNHAPNQNLVIHYIDVGQADCMLLIAGQTSVLIDGGNTDTSAEVVSYLRRYGIEELDLIVNTHPHGDHLGGIPSVMAAFPVKEVWCSHPDYDTYLFDRFEQALRQEGLTGIQPAVGTVYASDGLTITVLGPVQPNEHYTDLNDTSLVLLVQYGQRKFLFTGDMEAYAERLLATSGSLPDVDVLKVGHHGSYSSTSQELLDKVKPEYGIISCMLGNEYGHPHDAPMNRLKKAAVELYRTDLMGSVVLVTDGDTLAFFLETTNTELTGYEKAS